MSIEQKALTQALRLLAATKAHYHIELDGVEYGAALTPTEPKKPKRQIVYHGISKYVYPFLQNLNENASVRIPVPPEYPMIAVQRCACSYGSKFWGNGTYITAHEENHVEILRLSTENKT